MRRRTFLGIAAGSVVAWPRGGPAQPLSKWALIGFLGTSSKSAGARYYDGFPLGLRELGYLHGRDYLLEERYADGEAAKLPLLAQQLVQLNPDVIVVSNTAATLAARRATDRIPIVCGTIIDPVGLGLIASEARPRGNVTGILMRLDGLTGKQVDFALNLVPGATKIGVLGNPSNPAHAVQVRDAEVAAAKLGLTLVSVEVRTPEEIGAAFQTIVHANVDIVVVLLDAMLITMRRQIAAFALVARIPTVFGQSEHVEDGGLISYGINQFESFRRAAYYVDRILKGARPADLPVEFPTKLELVINLATAKALGIKVPPNLLAITDRVIE
jgi:putative ABC transport system substrate-binding protein